MLRFVGWATYICNESGCLFLRDLFLNFDFDLLCMCGGLVSKSLLAGIVVVECVRMTR